MKLKDYIEEIPDFPVKGILFKDISPLIANYQAMSYVKASFLKSNNIPSIKNSFSYCFMSAFFGCVIILINMSSSSSLKVVITGSLPINSGIMPNFSKS